MWKLFAVCLGISISIKLSTSNSSKLDPELARVIQNGERVSVVVYFKSGIQTTLRAVPLKRSGYDRGEHIKSIVDALEKNAATSQENVLQVLSARSGGAADFKYFKKYPTSNLIYIKEASPSVIQKIAEDEQVSRISLEPIVKLVDSTPDEAEPETKKKTPTRIDNSDEIQEELSLIQVPEAWEELGGNKGEGILIGSIDTGVRATHEALRDNFVGINYGWYDPVHGELEPSDVKYVQGGHGTHVIGTMVGTKRGIGVAPGAKWMTCKACNKTYCPYEGLRDCIKWIECPTLPNGSNPDCSKAPHIVNNSWQSIRGETGYTDDIMRWRAMGILPVFAIGNEDHKQCGTSKAPGEYPFVIGVGATDIKDDLYAFSAIGPASDGGFKPDLVAPGTVVCSSGALFDDHYTYKSGTSMAAPHVSGLLALLLVRNRDLTYEEAFQLLIQNTERDRLPTVTYHDNTCRNVSDNTVPSHWFGYGRINALKTVKAQTALLKAGRK